MTSNSLEKFESLLETDIREHVIDLMHEWCSYSGANLNSVRAAMITDEITSPLWIWIEKVTHLRKKTGNYQDIEAAQKFAIKADDIVYILKNNTRSLYPEHINMLNDAWLYFQNSIARSSIHIASNVDFVVTDKLQREADEKKQKSQIKIRKARSIWQNAGVNAARKYTEKDREEWRKQAKEMMKENNRIKSIRDLARKIVKRNNYPSSALETIRKDESIRNIYEKHNVNNISG